jgi:hypothetical protein
MTAIVSSGSAYLDFLRQGVDRAKLDEVTALAGLTKKEIADLLGVSERHLYNTSAKPFSVLQTEHLLSLEKLFQFGLSIFDGNVTVLGKWLRTPKASLAVPETGFPSTTPTDYIQPTLAELFISSTKEDNKQAMLANMAYNQETALNPAPPYPTPLSVLDTSFGVTLVGAIFGRIAAGVYS